MRKSAKEKTADRLDELMERMASKKTLREYRKVRVEFRKELGLAKQSDKYPRNRKVAGITYCGVKKTRY